MSACCHAEVRPLVIDLYFPCKYGIINHMSTAQERAKKAQWARERKSRIRLGLPQPGRGDGLRKYDHTGPTYRTQPAEYRAWTSMKIRCTDPNFKDWHLYGGRGIKVWEGWTTSFEEFFLHVGPRPSQLHSLDRYPDGDGNYEPGNVRWATRKEQARNWKHRNRLFTCRGESLTLPEWAERLGMARESLRDRIEGGWDVERALTTPPVRKRERGIKGTFQAVSL